MIWAAEVLKHNTYVLEVLDLRCTESRMRLEVRDQAIAWLWWPNISTDALHITGVNRLHGRRPASFDWGRR